jgi:carbonic anhydrase
MEKLLKGLEEYQREIHPRYELQLRELAHQQHPLAMMITCADSRIVPSLVLQAQPGELFICRNVGNIVPPYEDQGGVAASVEYAVDALHLRHIIVCGHSNCGAMQAVLHPERTLELPAARNWLRYAERARRLAARHGGDDEEHRLLRVTEQNIVAQIEHLEMYPCVADAQARGDLDLHGWYYDIPSGQIRMYDSLRALFVPYEGKLPERRVRRVWTRSGTAA